MRGLLKAFTVCSIYVLSWSFCWSLNDEGVALLRLKEKIESDPHGALSNWIGGVENPCSWFGVGCSDGYVVGLNLAGLCLKGTISPDIGTLIHVKSINLCNNSFYGAIPEEISNLKELELLDLRYNNFSGQLPCHLGSNFSTAKLCLDNNEVLRCSCPECKPSVVKANNLLFEPEQASFCNNLLISWKMGKMGNAAGRKLLQEAPVRRVPPLVLNLPPQPSRNLPPLSPNFRPRSVPSPSPASSPAPPPTPPPSSSPRQFKPPPSPSSVNRTTAHSLPTPRDGNFKRSGTNHKLILSASIGGSVLLLLLIFGIICYQTGKVATVRPWATGLSGQLQRAFVSGVPKVKRSELVAACEDFSNVIGSLSFCTLYKGTLSSGVEIAVLSIDTVSSKEWSSSMQSKFRKKIDMLSKVNHKNFVSLIGYCEDNVPFTRMMVFEYAPNGTLFEHLHIKEAEHLDWETRLRIAMGIAYSLDHMHHMAPALSHRNLTSSSVFLTEDYAAKLSDFTFWDKESSVEHPATPPSNVYSFGVVLFEIITGRLPYSSGDDSCKDWASDYLRGMQSVSELVDPTLRTYKDDQLRHLEEVVRLCTDPDSGRRPSMRDVCVRLRTITGIGADRAVPKLSPLWWAEIEIQSTEGK